MLRLVVVDVVDVGAGVGLFVELVVAVDEAAVGSIEDEVVVIMVVVVACGGSMMNPGEDS